VHNKPKDKQVVYTPLEAAEALELPVTSITRAIRNKKLRAFEDNMKKFRSTYKDIYIIFEDDLQEYADTYL